MEKDVSPEKSRRQRPLRFGKTPGSVCLLPYLLGASISLPPPLGMSRVTPLGCCELCRDQGKDVVAEFDVSGELGEACTCLSEVDSTLRWAAVSEAINDSMERKQKHRDSLGEDRARSPPRGVCDLLGRGTRPPIHAVHGCADEPGNKLGSVTSTLLSQELVNSMFA